MAKLSVCIEMFWRDKPYEERIRLAGKTGHKAVEFWGWKNKDLAKVKRAATASKTKIVIFSMQADRPLVDPNAGDALKAGLKESIAAARKLGVDRLIITTGNERPQESFRVTRNTVVRNLKKLVPLLSRNRITLCIEPLNTKHTHPAYWLTLMSDAADICREVDSPWVKILMDFYHQQIQEGNLIATMQECISLIGHFHSAGVPGRHELVGSELDYRSIFKAVDETGYKGHIGLEFSPTMDDAAALKQTLELVK